VLIDGYDGAVMTYAAPAIVTQIKLDPALLGPLFAAHLVGTILGSGPSGLIADSHGRRPTVIWATVMFGVFTALTATAASYTGILIYRLLTGIGLGAAASNTVALASEYSSGRFRATVVAVVYSALPLGALAGGYVAVPLIRAFGWRSVFVLGATLAVAGLVIAVWRMPESVRFLHASGAKQAQLDQALARLGMHSGAGEDYEERDVGVGSGASPVKDLFVGGRAFGTVALWVAFFVNQLVVYFVFTWTPIVFKARGLSGDLGILASATLNLGAVVGSVCLARLIDKRGARPVLTTSYIAAFLAISAFGTAASTGAALMLVLVALTGFALNGSNVNLAGVATSFYPTRARATGVGWAIGIGRAGGIVGSVIGGVLLRTKLGLSVLYPLVGSALLLAALAIWLMYGRRGRAAPLQAELT
jgi:AAHS family 4-hydroxybenzoate transporter-like MFS transporter